VDGDRAGAHWLGELDEDECWRRLETQAIGRLAWSSGGRTAIVPLAFSVVDRRIVVRTAAYNELAREVGGLQVAFEVDAYDEERRTGWSVVVSGTAALDQHGGAGTDPEPWPSGQRSLRIVVTPQSVTGRDLR
jgi:uncharacterized protein